MGNPYLDSDESIILATHNIFIKSVRSDVILTNQRLIISDSSHAQFRPQTIPLAAVMTITSGESGLGHPVLTLSLAAAHDATEPLELIFFQKDREHRQQECDDWVQKLGEHAVTARKKAEQSGITMGELVAAISAERTAAADVAKDEHTPAPSEPDAPRKQNSFSRPASGVSKIIAIAAIIIVILAVAGGVYLFTHTPAGKTNVPVVPVTTTAIPTPVPAQTSLEPVVPVTPEPAASPEITALPMATPQFIIPETGVWVRITCPGNYAGSVGTAGDLRKVQGTGVQFYQLPATPDSFIDIAVQKESGSGDLLSADIYNNGVLVRHGSTTAPEGLLEIHFNLKTATLAASGQ